MNFFSLNRIWMLLALCAAFLLVFGCAGDDDDDAQDQGPGDDDAAGDDDIGDDDTGDDDSDDDWWDIWIEPWPQNPVPPRDHDETPEPGPLRIKAQGYDLWHEANHQPFYGSTVGALFVDDSRTEVQWYFGSGDSCIWTGTYLASQAMRYFVTGDEQAKLNAIRTVQALDGHLHVTGRDGFIARYRGPQDPKVMPGNCGTQENEDCHVIESGLYAGDFWTGNTSRDQYTGWFFGMALAYDLVDDEDMRAVIREDVAEVLDELIRTNFKITDVDGKPTTAGPGVILTYRLNWYLIGYHVTGRQEFKEVVQDLIRDEKRSALEIAAFSFMNRYLEYYGNNLGHQNFYNLLRLASVYLNTDDYLYLKSLFEDKQHRWMHLTHNAFFNMIHMSQGIYEPGFFNDPEMEQLLQDLTDFRPAPNYRVAVDPPEAEIDPISELLDQLWEWLPFLKELWKDIDPQAKYAYPVLQQCYSDFLWQRNPFRFECGGQEMPRSVEPGVDYLVAYWMSSFHKYLTKDM